MALVMTIAAGGCQDEGPFLFPPADHLVPLLEGTPAAEVGSAVELGPLFVLQDRHGNPVPEVRVPVEVVEGRGTLATSIAVSDAQGRVALPTFTLDTVAGPARLELRPPGLPPRQVMIQATPGRTADFRLISEADSTFLGEGEVGTTLPEPVTVRLTDRFGNPVPNQSVIFEPVAGGGVAGEGGAPGRPHATLLQSGPDGTASAVWRLGNAPGINRLSVRTDLYSLPALEAMAVAGPLESLVPVSAVFQSGQVSEAVPFPPIVEATDHLGNPLAGIEVRFAVESGAGEVTPESVETDDDGRAAVQAWTLGPAAGTHTLSATAGNVSTLFTSEATLLPPGPQLRIEAVHLNQGAQTLEGGIDLVAGRDAFLRIFVTAPEPVSVSPDVDVELFSGTTPLGVHRISAGSDTIRSEIDPDRPERSWNLRVDGSMIQPGFGLRVTLDPDEVLPGEGRGGFVYPAPDEVATLPVRTLEPLEVVLVPIRQAASGLEGQVDAGNVEAFLGLAGRLFPVDEILWSLRSPYVTQIEITNDFNRWSQVISELLAVRTDEETGNAYYYGVVRVEYPTGIAGVGYIPPSPAHPEKVALGWDRPATRGYIAAHELGHNLGRRHAPCGGASGPDPNFPHPDARIGSPGWDLASGELLPTGELRDIMSYCRPEWVSDYTFAGLLDWVDQLSAGSSSVAGASEGLLVWGRTNRDGLHLEPLFRSSGVPVLPPGPGHSRLIGRSADGGTIFDLPFEATPVAHAPDPTEAQFAFRVPLSAAEQARLVRVELHHEGRVTVREAATAPQPLLLDPPTPMAERAAPGEVRVQWDAGAHPLAVVRDGSGAILSLARDGTAIVETGDDRIEVTLSDGIRSRQFEVEVMR